MSILGNDEVLQEGVSDFVGILAVTVLSTMQQGACGMIVRIRLFVNALQNDIPQTDPCGGIISPVPRVLIHDNPGAIPVGPFPADDIFRFQVGK